MGIPENKERVTISLTTDQAQWIRVQAAIAKSTTGAVVGGLIDQAMAKQDKK